MRLNEIIKRELEVAFSKNSQPAWFRISKYILLIAVLYFLWGSKWLWTIVLSMLGVALLLHFWYRYKTKSWTKSYGMWKYDKK
jgi:O-antigen/teichoic acid export membrane protein